MGREIGMEVVQKEKGIKEGDMVIAEGPFQMNAGPSRVGLLFQTLLILRTVFISFLPLRNDLKTKLSQPIPTDPFFAGIDCRNRR